MNNALNRCSWCNMENELYVKYHDEEWGVSNFDDDYLFEMLLLESFQSGLSWQTILNKRENFREAFDNFDAKKISQYSEDKLDELYNNSGIIRHKLKINATIQNARVFIKIQDEFGSFHNYLTTFTNGVVIYENDKTKSSLSDKISRDLKKRGMKFIGSTTIYSYLQAVGVINSHMDDCFLYGK